MREDLVDACSATVRVGWPGASKDEVPAKEERGNLHAVLRHFVLERPAITEMMEKVRRHVRMYVADSLRQAKAVYRRM